MKYLIISGIDGSGKTSIINALERNFKGNNIDTLVIWLRYSHYCVKPLHAISRLIGLSKKYDTTLGEVWRHEFYKSTLFCWLYIRLTFLDTLIGKLKLKLKIRNKPDIVICDRWLNDILIDLAVKTRDENFLNSKWFFRFKLLLPKKNREFLIFRDEKDLLECRLENRDDPDFKFRLKQYEKLKQQKTVISIDNNRNIKDAVKDVLNSIQE